MLDPAAGQTSLFPGREINSVEIVLADERDALAVGREAGELLSVGASRQAGETPLGDPV